VLSHHRLAILLADTVRPPEDAFMLKFPGTAEIGSCLLGASTDYRSATRPMACRLPVAWPSFGDVTRAATMLCRGRGRYRVIA